MPLVASDGSAIARLAGGNSDASSNSPRNRTRQARPAPADGSGAVAPPSGGKCWARHADRVAEPAVLRPTRDAPRAGSPSGGCRRLCWNLGACLSRIGS